MSSAKQPNDNETDACDGCSLGRRAFLRDAGLLAAGALIALGATPEWAAASIRHITATDGLGEDKQYPLPAADGVQIDKKNALMLARYQGTVFAFSLACPHQNTALRWYDKDHQFECPKHHSRYRPDGVFIEGRATRGLDRYAVRKEGSMVIADLDKLYEEDKDEQWKTAFVTV
jgi:nitrite reductase/ring-hydroxylating ferredoxin subunit